MKNKNQLKFGTLVLAITNYCNSKCSFCAVDAVCKKEKSSHLSLYEMKKIIKTASEFGCEEAIFSGGEPLTMSNNVLKAIKYANSKNLRTILVTNAFFATTLDKAEKMAKRLEEAGLDILAISFDYDHLKYIPYKNILNMLKAALKFKMILKVEVIDRKFTRDKNTQYIKRLVNDLGAEIKNGIIPKFMRYMIGYPTYPEFYYFLKIGDKYVRLARERCLYIGRARKLKNDYKLINIKNFLFRKCIFTKNHMIIVKSDKKVLGCGSCSSMNENTSIIGSINDSDLKEKFMNKRNLMIDSGVFDRFGFVKAYLSLKDVDKKNILKSKYPVICLFCFKLLKMIRKKELNKIKGIDILFFTIRNFHFFLRSLINDFLFDIIFSNTGNAKNQRFIRTVIKFFSTR